MIPLPDPPLRSGDLLLRPWRIEDAPALVDAWADPEIQRWTAVPPVRDLAYAEHWIAGDEERRRRWLSLDLVVERDGEVAGEVGLSSIDRASGVAEIGWWTAADHRRRRVASTAANLVFMWSIKELGIHPLARIDLANVGATGVAAYGAIRVWPLDAPWPPPELLG